MAVFQLATRDIGRITFCCADSGGYVRAIIPGQTNALGGVIGAGGGVIGADWGIEGCGLGATAKTLASVARAWNRARRAAIRGTNRY